jgi:acetylornithine deacetylase/succinyl-diaminopimelate desuccinylase-like protein
MLVTAFLQAHAAGRRGLVLVVLSDEENGGDAGARLLVEERPGAFRGARHALGEWGGATVHIARRRFYPIQVAEKQLDRRKLPVHVTPVVHEWFSRMADALPRAQAFAMRRLLDARTADLALPAFGPRARQLDRVLRNTVSATIVHGGEKINVIPSEVELQLDGRLLPGFAPDDLVCELTQLLGDAVELEVVRHDAGPAEPDLSFFEPLADVLRELDPYPLIHAADERVPADAVRFGVEAVRRAIEQYTA